MARYVAFLRGVSPMNLKMPDLKRCFESAGFSNVRTLLSSGNVVFDTSVRSEMAVVRKAEAAMPKHLDRSFLTIVRTASRLQALIEADPYADFSFPANAKRVVTFLSEPSATKIAFPPEKDGARMLAVQGSEVFSVYVPGPRGSVFMALIEKTFGSNVTTRTWETVRKCANA